MKIETEHCIDTCNKLLRGERSAVETYDMAIANHGDDPSIQALIVIRDEHSSAVALLDQNVRTMGGVPDKESGAWGAFARTVQSAANLFGSGSAIEALKQGEEHGRKDYLEALEDEGVMAESKTLIRDQLLPKTRQHIATLERLEKNA